MKVDLRTSQQSSPQGLRRPRFSFFRFTCQTARDHDSPTPGKPESRRSSTLPIRIGSLGHRISVRCFAGATSRRKRTARRMGLYSLAAGGLSTLKARTRVESRRPPKITHGAGPAAPGRALRPPGGYLGRRRPQANRRGNVGRRGDAPHCGHIPPPFLVVLVGGVSSGESAPGSLLP